MQGFLFNYKKNDKRKQKIFFLQNTGIGAAKLISDAPKYAICSIAPFLSAENFINSLSFSRVADK